METKESQLGCLYGTLVNINIYILLQVQKKIANNALATLTLMIALSKPDEKELMIKVIINSINMQNEAL